MQARLFKNYEKNPSEPPPPPLLYKNYKLEKKLGELYMQLEKYKKYFYRSEEDSLDWFTRKIGYDNYEDDMEEIEGFMTKGYLIYRCILEIDNIDLFINAKAHQMDDAIVL
jgi:hypothetical protein